MKSVHINENMQRMKESLDNLYQDTILPEALGDKYQILTCLKATEDKNVYVLLHKASNQRYILKSRTGETSDMLQEEYAILTAFEDESLPKAVLCCSEGESTYLLREYIFGETLEQCVEKNGVYDVEQAAAILCQLCNTVQKLHRHNPPLIHRDIKPQNILASEHGRYVLIDMDTVREYKKEQAYDTVSMGTRGLAAPEQYGYQQTTIRADIYGLGMTLLYLVTGDYRMKGREWEELPTFLQHIIRKCLAFDPDKRYGSVGQLQKQLQQFIHLDETKKWKIPILLAGVGLVLLLGMIYIIGINRRTVQFVNPEIEMAVRVLLEKKEEETITTSELNQVHTLIICNNQVFTSWEEHEAYHSDYWFEYKENIDGGKQEFDLSDLDLFPNLDTLVLDGQGVTDIDELLNHSLTRVSLRDNQVVDISPLRTDTKLQVLNISGNPITTIEPLREAENLTELYISETNVSDISCLSGSKLSVFDCMDTAITNYSVLESMEWLSSLRLSGVGAEVIRFINTKPGIRFLGLYNCDISSIEELSELKYLECLDIGGCSQVTSLDGIEQYPKLNYLGISRTGITDITALNEVRGLERLDIAYTNIENYEILEKCPNLLVVFVDHEQEASVQAMKGKNCEILLVD